MGAATFPADGALLQNPDHENLVDSDIGYLWAAIENRWQMRRVTGQCEEVTRRRRLVASFSILMVRCSRSQ